MRSDIVPGAIFPNCLNHHSQAFMTCGLKS